MVRKPGYWTRLHGLATVLLVGVALWFLFVEHRAHVLEYLPFLIILLCPLMHVFMHKGHGEHRHPDAEEAFRRGVEAGRKEAEEQGHI